MAAPAVARLPCRHSGYRQFLAKSMMVSVLETPPTPFDRALDRHLSEISQGLWALLPGYRRALLRDMRADLLDLAEDHGFQDEADLEAYLRTQPSPAMVARAIQREELDYAYWRILVALIPMFMAGLWSLLTQPSPITKLTAHSLKQVLWFGCLTYLHFALRALWARQREPQRLLWGALFGALGGFVWFALRLDSWPDLLARPWLLFNLVNQSGAWVIRGAFLGFMVERVASRRRWWVMVLDAPLFLLLLNVHAKMMHKILLARRRPAAPVVETIKGARRAMQPPIQMAPTRPIPGHFLPVTIGLQAILWAGARTSRRIELFRLFRMKGSKPQEPDPSETGGSAL